MKPIPLYLFLLIIIACNNDSGKKVMISNKNTLSIPADSSVFYFPIKELSKNAGPEETPIDSFVNKWFSGMLFALHEPVLYNANTKDKIYRFTWLRTFHSPAVVRIQTDDRNYSVSVKMSDGAGGYEPGKIILDSFFTISKIEWDAFISGVNKADFWNSPTAFKSNGTDGSEWVLEALDNNSYHVVIRWAPDEEYKEFRDCCMYLLKLSGLDKREEYIY
jgi:hypothetical protein